MGARQALEDAGLVGSLMAQRWLTWKELPRLLCGCRLDTGHGSSAHGQEVSTQGTSGPRALLLPS